MKTTRSLNKGTFFQGMIAILMIVLLLTSILCIHIKAINQRWHFTFDNIGFDLDASGWYAAYGGNIAVTSEEHHSGNYSLKMTGRTQAWHSPALNLDRIFYEGGPGIYVFTVWVKVKNVNPYLRKYARSIVRGQELTSFIEQYEENYFHPIELITTQENTWQCIQGWISVRSEDIHKGTFSWMLDVIDPMEGQIVYIDDFDIFKSSDNPNYMQPQEAVINDKPYDPNTWYPGAGDLKGDEAVAWYYDTMVNTDYKKHLELVYTLSGTKIKSLYSDLKRRAEQELTQREIEALAETLNDATELLMQNIPMMAPFLVAIDILSVIQDMVSPIYDFQWNKIRNAMDRDLEEEGLTQEFITASIHLLKHDTLVLDSYQVKIQWSDGRKEVVAIDKIKTTD